MRNLTRFTTPAEERLADLMSRLNQKYRTGLQQQKYHCQLPNDNDGAFIRAGISPAILNIGSFSSLFRTKIF